MKTEELIASLLLLMSASVMSAQPAPVPIEPGGNTGSNGNGGSVKAKEL